MSHLEERLEHDLNHIRDHIARMGADVEQALEAAFRALESGDDRLAFKTILSDLPINRHMREIDRLCHAFIAVHLPSAGHLRLISSVIRANIILERIGDYAVTIAREAVQLGENSGADAGEQSVRKPRGAAIGALFAGVASGASRSIAAAPAAGVGDSTS